MPPSVAVPPSPRGHGAATPRGHHHGARTPLSSRAPAHANAVTNPRPHAPPTPRAKEEANVDVFVRVRPRPHAHVPTTCTLHGDERSLSVANASARNASSAVSIARVHASRDAIRSVATSLPSLETHASYVATTRANIAFKSSSEYFHRGARVAAQTRPPIRD